MIKQASHVHREQLTHACMNYLMDSRNSAGVHNAHVPRLSGALVHWIRDFILELITVMRPVGWLTAPRGRMKEEQLLCVFAFLMNACKLGIDLRQRNKLSGYWKVLINVFTPFGFLCAIQLLLKYKWRRHVLTWWAIQQDSYFLVLAHL